MRAGFGGKNAGSDDSDIQSWGMYEIKSPHVFLGDDTRNVNDSKVFVIFFSKDVSVFLFVKISLCFAGVLKNSASSQNNLGFPNGCRR